MSLIKPLDERHNQGGRVLNVPRGFGAPDESRDAAAARELLEETGLTDDDVSMTPLAGSPVNADSAFLETDAPDDGVQFFAGQIPEAELARRHGQIGLRTPRPAPGAAEEQLSPLVFIPWQQAVQLADMFTVAAVSRLLAALVQRGEVTLSR